jgi:hypothetical protein
MKESNQNNDMIYNDNSSTTNNNKLLITKRIQLIALHLFELIQLSLQCGPLHGAKPGYFKRCGNKFAIMIYQYLNHIQSYYILDHVIQNEKSSNQPEIINDDIHENDITHTDYLNDHDDQNNPQTNIDNDDDNVKSMSSSDENDHDHDDVDCFVVRDAKDFDINDNVDNFNAEYLNDNDNPNNQLTNNDSDDDSVDSMSSTDENNPNHNDDIDVTCTSEMDDNMLKHSSNNNSSNVTKMNNSNNELTTNRLFLTTKQVKAIELWMSRCKKIALISNENNNIYNNIINGGNNVQSTDNNDDNIIINEDVASKTTFDNNNNNNNNKSHNERLPSKHVQKQIFDGMKNHQKKKSLRQKKKEIRLLNEKRKK